MPLHAFRRNHGGSDGLIRRESDYWTIAYDGLVVRLRDRRQRKASTRDYMSMTMAPTRPTLVLIAIRYPPTGTWPLAGLRFRTPR